MRFNFILNKFNLNLTAHNCVDLIAYQYFAQLLIFFCFFFSSLSEISTVPDFQILGSQPSKRADEDAQFHHLLDNAMFDPRRRVNFYF